MADLQTADILQCMEEPDHQNFRNRLGVSTSQGDLGLDRDELPASVMYDEKPDFVWRATGHKPENKRR